MDILIERSEDYLQHHGVKGMKWGKWNAETAARYAGGKGLIPGLQGGGYSGAPNDKDLEAGIRRDVINQMGPYGGVLKQEDFKISNIYTDPSGKDYVWADVNKGGKTNRYKVYLDNVEGYSSEKEHELKEKEKGKTSTRRTRNDSWDPTSGLKKKAAAQHDAFFVERTDDYLEHHGVMGMKWGKRNAETMARYARESGSKARKAAESTPDFYKNAHNRRAIRRTNRAERLTNKAYRKYKPGRNTIKPENLANRSEYNVYKAQKNIKKAQGLNFVAEHYNRRASKFVGKFERKTYKEIKDSVKSKLDAREIASDKADKLLNETIYAPKALSKTNEKLDSIQRRNLQLIESARRTRRV